ncbi:MAG: hypothetical protein MHMPM18_001692 [Marteilia pararefringens]
MWDHLLRHHKPIYSKQKEGPPPTKSQKLDKFVPYANGSIEKKSIDRSVFGFVVGGLHPFIIVNSKPFINMCKDIDARYTPPSSQTIGNNLLDERYYELQNKLKNEISKLPDGTTISLTTDGSTSSDADHSKYNSLTCSFFDPEWKKI